MNHKRSSLLGSPASSGRKHARLARASRLLASLLVAGLVLAACGPTPAPQTIVKTVIVEQTKIVEREGEVVTVVETVE